MPFRWTDRPSKHQATNQSTGQATINVAQYSFEKQQKKKKIMKNIRKWGKEIKMYLNGSKTNC